MRIDIRLIGDDRMINRDRLLEELEDGDTRCYIIDGTDVEDSMYVFTSVNGKLVESMMDETMSISDLFDKVDYITGGYDYIDDEELSDD